MKSWLFVCFLLAAVCSTRAEADDSFSLKIPDNNLTVYVSNLLGTALARTGHTVEIDLLDPSIPMPRQMVMLDLGKDIDLFWRGEDEMLKRRFLEVPVDLTEGLKGVRVLFVRPGDEERYADVGTLDEFRNKKTVGVFGQDWNDIGVWSENGLPYEEWRGRWNPDIFHQLAAGRTGVDYFSRGIMEIAVEAPQFPDLAVERHLALVYENDFRLYVSRNNPELHALLTDALQVVEADGTLSRMLREAFPEVYDEKALNLAGRRIIQLQMP
ncbi:hypothetical protein JM93_00814 [Roseibium hamelinense]|uniref:ABC-type amino acid transport substrate-binding protein n=1 Tax=Roseibium hamelinense TaxID=150831 RepID=A0A562THU6_9HYPH|nr:amino acid ABC transporter substrate-binding protein [Roseibium hamelinense]MTI42635.1 hypothetical protein [Roseibium hamelinense]TWI93259.1 hypothetical protein JM93_00814 [Roseibium hamelinense]